MASEQDATGGRSEAETPDDYEVLLARFVDLLLDGEHLDEEVLLDRYPDVGARLIDDLRSFIDPASTASTTVGETLSTIGDYSLSRRIGRGGMGVVYEAWENSLDRRVALKVLPVGVAADERAFQRFMREARTAGKLQHPNVVSVYAMGVTQETPYYAMEYVEGETLAVILSKIREIDPGAETAFGPKDDIRYFANLAVAFASVADGVHHAHQSGVTHRDLKPSNLILDREGNLRVLDFGLARLEGQETLTKSGDVLGTPQYMSPEQARRKNIRVDHRTDIWSLGATMYEVVAGRPAFGGKDHHDTLSRIIEQDPIAPRKLNARIPRDLETLVLKCLRKHAVDRYGTAEALAQDLGRFVRGEPVEARPLPRLESALRRLRRHGVRAAMIVALVSVVVGSLYMAFAFHERWREEELGEGTALHVARVLRGRGHIEDANALYRKTIRLQPNVPSLRLELAEMLVSTGRHNEALRVLADATCASDPSVEAMAHVRLTAMLLWGQATDVSALGALFDCFDQHRPEELAATALETIAVASLHQADPERFALALDFARRALRRSEERAPHFFATLAAVERRVGAADEARATWEALLRRLAGSVAASEIPNGYTLLFDRFSTDFLTTWQPVPRKESVTAIPGEFLDGDPGVRMKSLKPSRAGALERLQLVLDSADPVLSQGYYRLKVRSDAEGCHVGLLLRGRGDESSGYRFVLSPTEGFFGIELKSSRRREMLARTEPPGLEGDFGTDWFLEAGVVGDRLSLKAWRAVEREPDSPQLVVRHGEFSIGKVSLLSVVSFHGRDTGIDATYSELSFRPVLDVEKPAEGPVDEMDGRSERSETPDHEEHEIPLERTR